MGNKKSKLVEKKYVRIQTSASKTNKQGQSNDGSTEFLSKETQLRIYFERREAERKQLAEKSYETKPAWKFEKDNIQQESDLRRQFDKRQTERINAQDTVETDRIEQQNMRDVEKVLDAIKPGKYKEFCDLLQTHPFIQHWKVFEEAVDVDISWSGALIDDRVAVTPDCQLFTLRLMDNDYQITEKQLERMEMRLFLKVRFRMLKRCILDHYLGGVKSLQELCRLSLKKFQQHDESNYRDFVKRLNYPERLKDFLLQ